MVDEERVLRLLAGIEADTAFLRRLAQRDEDDLLSDELALSAVKYRFITAIEGCARVAHHLAAAEGWPAAETNADAVRELARRDVIGTRLATAVAEAVGFRNLLVHQYADVDDHRTVANLQRLDDLEAFTAAVARWLAGPQAG